VQRKIAPRDTRAEGSHDSHHPLST
jgi:hypothetical protein